MKEINRRSFMRIAGMSLGVGALYQVPPVKLNAESNEIFNWMGEKNGERPAPFSFVQLSDSHVRFNGPPNPLGTKAFETRSRDRQQAATASRSGALHRKESSREFFSTAGIQHILKAGVME